MAGAMRKMGIYLGLVEEDDRHAEEAEYGHDRRPGNDYPDAYAEEFHGARRRPERVERPERPERVERPRAWTAPPAPVADVDFYQPRQAAAVTVDDEPTPYRITTLHPRTYNEARTIGEHFRDGVPVILNLTEMDDSDAKRLVDFAAGLSFGLRGSIERVTNKVFLLSPQNVSVTAEDKARIVEGGFFNQS